MITVISTQLLCMSHIIIICKDNINDTFIYITSFNSDK